VKLHRHIPQLDGLRAIAVLMVLITHFWGYHESHPILNRFAASGWIGVDLFFVLSGFLITSILWDARSQPGYYLNFYARRTLRIFPIYYLVLAFVFIALPLVSTLPTQLADDAWLYALYLGNFALAAGGWQLFLIDITWSLAIEEQFYLLWPAILRRISLRGFVILCAAIILALPLIRFALWAPDRWMWLHMMMPLRADSLAMGALIAVLWRNEVKMPAGIVMALAAPVLVGLIAFGEFRRESMIVGTIGYSLTALVAGAGLLLAMRAPVLATAPLMHLGKVSYGMYLYHPIVLMVMSSVLAKIGLVTTTMTGMLVQLAALIGATVLCASLSFWVLEERLLRLKRFFVPKPPMPATPSVARDEAS
jgi:peptidoglycan/LPS O-acetylase OafA/YrhL